MSKRPKKPLRSQAWFARQDKMGFYYRSLLKNRGFPQDQFEGRPVIGICNTWSELTPCNSHFRTIAEHVRWGVLDAGGFPLEFPVMSLGEVTMRPTAMLYRNLASMDVEESIRAHPLDGVVLLMGCDKTTPGPPDGRGQRRPADDRRFRRPAAARRLPRPDHRLGHQHHLDERAAARRRDHARGVPRGRGRDEPLRTATA